MESATGCGQVWSSSGCQNSPRLSRILSNLGLEFVQPGEAFFFTQQRDQSDTQCLTVEVFIKIEEMSFEAAFPSIVDRGTTADIGHSRDYAAVWKRDADGVNPTSGLDMLCQGNVGCGEAEQTTALVALHNFARNCPWTPKLGCSAFGVTLLQQATDAAGGKWTANI